LQVKQSHIILGRRDLSPSVFTLRLDKNGFTFEPGQYAFINLPGDENVREYSIYSSTDDPFLELLIKEVSDGFISKKLRKLNPGDKLELEGPYGFFTINKSFHSSPPLLLASTGTGIAPFHSFIRSMPYLKYRLLHGVRYGYETYERNWYSNYILCTSRDTNGDFHGRVTQYQKNNPVSPDHLCYLSGNYAMVEEMTDILLSQGISYQQIFSEVHN
jgi:ferredoxin--NADP+ reductase/benzoate/toluate 1,2-dioxygenase reductase subunit